ncbi:hypothetical protein ABZP36_030614 [Zizania latifolia]
MEFCCSTALCPSSPSICALILFLSSCRYNVTRWIFDGLPTRSVVTWNSFLAALAHRRDVRTAREFFVAMPVWDARSWNTLLATPGSSRGCA